MHRSILGGIASIALWVVIVVVAQWHSGLVHIPLAVGTVLIARGIVLSNRGAPSA